jgi:[lysine-biosynthesis-protein LysW]--L-2-aminoadipate ligase
MQNVTNVFYGGKPVCDPDDVVLARCVSHGENESVAAFLESEGVRVVNSSKVMRLCGNKLLTTLALKKAGIPQPEFRLAFTPEAALEASAEFGFPVVYKPVTGSWGRLLAKANDAEAAEAVLEHKAMMGSIHNIFYIQEYIEKGGFDVRAFVVNGRAICAINRTSEHWITNTARGGKASNFPLDDDVKALLKSLHDVVGGEFLAADIFNVNGKWLVNEVNDGGEFRNSTEPTGTDIPGAIVRAAWETRQS